MSKRKLTDEEQQTVRGLIRSAQNLNMKKQADTKSTETRLRESIQRELMKCDPSVTPAVCARTKTVEGYRAVEEEIITMVVKQGLMPAACVAQLEAEWATN